jgi:tripartite-type tricarboxylate transporter receptor subunit TctC
VFQKAAGIKLRHIPYKGGAPAINDVVGGHVDIFFAAIPPALPQVQSGNVKTFGITGKERSETAPEIPTLAEEGVSGVYLNAWFGLLAPAGLPPEIRGKLTDALRKALASRGVHEIFRKNGAKAGTLFGHDFRVFLNAENDEYRKLIAAARLAPE